VSYQCRVSGYIVFNLIQIKKTESGDSRSVQIGMSCIGISIAQLVSRAGNIGEEIRRFQCESHTKPSILFYKRNAFLTFIILLCFSVRETSSTHSGFRLFY